jgi:hypothetical protein
VLCRPAGPETKPGHGPVAIKRVMLGRRALPCQVGPKSGYAIIYLFLYKFCLLIKKLFNIIKFELKIYDFTLNNIIKNILYHF